MSPRGSHSSRRSTERYTNCKEALRGSYKEEWFKEMSDELNVIVTPTQLSHHLTMPICSVAAGLNAMVKERLQNRIHYINK